MREVSDLKNLIGYDSFLKNLVQKLLGNIWIF